MLDRLESAFGRLTLFLASLVALSIALIAILIPLDLLIRRLGWGNMPWLYEGIEYALYVGVFLAAPWVLHQRAHVRVDVIVSTLPRGLARRLEQALDLVGAIIAGGLCYYGVRATITDFVEESKPDKLLVIADWWMMLVFAIACLMLAIEFLLRLRNTRRTPGAAGPSVPEARF
ncbi:MAG: TRAP transporter small permease [Alphaproteobacteria bacterium]|jgi:TRAP-type C4-dicarboxylate transport system permease small subunit|nr:TRAP transporter small permease [Alphaproteobacteria bacterium]